MKLTVEQFTTISEAFENSDSTTNRYSGRGMYGKQCLSVTCDNPMKALLDAIACFAEAYQETKYWPTTC